MNRLFVFLFVVLNSFVVFSQVTSNNSFIKDMQWGVDYRIHLTLFNDSNYTINVEDMVHSNSANNDTSLENFVYYPVMLARDFVDRLKKTKSDEKTVVTLTTETNDKKLVTLWGSLHSSLGGGWVHFINCLEYSMETRYLSITAPLMERPKTSWKPNPRTDTYKRTRKWKYYVPVDQRQAHKEYARKVRDKQLDNLQEVPKSFIKLFLETNNRDYKKIVESRNFRKLAQIDLVKLLVGSNYLSEPQITYIKTMVLKSVLQYSYNQLPTVIVFDDLEAAVVMSLNETGYNLEQVVFRSDKDLAFETKNERLDKINLNIRAINKINQKIFQEQLKKHFTR